MATASGSVPTFEVGCSTGKPLKRVFDHLKSRRLRAAEHKVPRDLRLALLAGPEGGRCEWTECSVHKKSVGSLVARLRREGLGPHGKDAKGAAVFRLRYCWRVPPSEFADSDMHLATRAAPPPMVVDIRPPQPLSPSDTSAGAPLSLRDAFHRRFSPPQGPAAAGAAGVMASDPLAPQSASAPVSFPNLCTAFPAAGTPTLGGPALHGLLGDSLLDPTPVAPACDGDEPWHEEARGAKRARLPTRPRDPILDLFSNLTAPKGCPTDELPELPQTGPLDFRGIFRH